MTIRYVSQNDIYSYSLL